MKNAVFLDVTPCGPRKNRCSSETTVLARPTRRHIPEGDILVHSNQPSAGFNRSGNPSLLRNAKDHKGSLLKSAAGQSRNVVAEWFIFSGGGGYLGPNTRRRERYVSCLPCSSTPKMESTCSSETYIEFCPKDRKLVTTASSVSFCVSSDSPSDSETP
jgi:hypothetical protein